MSDGEHRLECDISRIRAYWSSLETPIKKCHDQVDSYVLGDVNDIMTQIEDDQSSLQTMMHSEWATAIKSQVHY